MQIHTAAKHDKLVLWHIYIIINIIITQTTASDLLVCAHQNFTTKQTDKTYKLNLIKKHVITL